jgi:N-acetyl-anhydromuramyl-L-alanine amidase AmpD
MDLHLSTREFLTRLKKAGYNASNAQTANDSVQAVQRSGVPQGYKPHWDQINQLYDRVSQGVQSMPKADYQEYPKWSPSSSSRNGTKVDLFLLHTQEGGGGDHAADDLAVFLGNPANQVSYHYCVSTASDGGTTVVDVVDTDEESWSVLSANPRSINLCFAGSRAAWTRDQWMGQAHAIDVAAYIAVQDCKKYGIPIVVNPPPYKQQAGISDHAYVTKILKDGTHTDVGPNFPWDVFTAAVSKYAGAAQAPAPVKAWPQSATDRELLEYIAAQLGSGDPSWPSKGMTLRDKVWTLGDAS